MSKRPAEVPWAAKMRRKPAVAFNETQGKKGQILRSCHQPESVESDLSFPAAFRRAGAQSNHGAGESPR